MVEKFPASISSIASCQTSAYTDFEEDVKVDMPPKTMIDFSKITGKFPLLAVFLCVVEGLLGFWFFRAEGGIERGFAGSLMTLILLGFLFVVLGISKEEKVTGPTAQGLGKVTPARQSATEEEIREAAAKKEAKEEGAQTIAAPDASYIINKPPKDWIVRELTYVDWIIEKWGITDSSVKEAMLRALPQQLKQIQGILAFQSGRETSVIPIPGETIIDGRKVPSALETVIRTELAVLPMDRAQPPLFVERSLQHYFLTFVGQILSPGMITAHAVDIGTIPDSHRPYLKAEFRQEILNAIVNGKDRQSVNNNVTVFGIDGELRDYLLIMTYPSSAGAELPELERDREILRSLLESFRPVTIINPEQKRLEIKQMADQKFEELMREAGEKIFLVEFGILLLKLKGWDMNNPEKRLKAMKLLKPFELFAKEVNLQAEDWDALWKALRLAEEGDASLFKDQIHQMINAASSELEPSPENLPLPASDNKAEKESEAPLS